MSDCEEIFSISESSPLESIIKVEEPEFQTSDNALEEICDLTEKDCATSEEVPIIVVEDTLQLAVVLSPLDEASINWWRGRSASPEVKSPEKEIEIAPITDNIVIDLTGEETPESAQLDEPPTLSEESTFPRKRKLRGVFRKLYFCKCCVYETIKRTHLKRHLQTARHRRNQQISGRKTKKVETKDSRNVSTPERAEQPPISNFRRHCEICGSNFRSDSLMTLHWQEEHFKVHGDRSAWIESAKKSQRITRSVYNHTGSKACNVCRKIFSTEASLNRHKTAYHANFVDSSLSDTEQMDEEPNLDPLQKATSDAPEVQKYSCKMCDYETTRKDLLRGHLKTQKHIMNELNRITTPADQGMQCIQARNESHCCQINLHSKIINVLDSGSIFNTYNSVVNGQGNGNKKTKVRSPKTKQKNASSEVKPLKVTTCSCCYKQVNAKFLKVHMKQKHRKRYFPCQDCTEVFNYSEHLRMHFLDMHFCGPLKRCHCGVAYKNNRDLSRHQAVHDPPIICYICKRIFNVKNSLSSHWRKWHAQVYGNLSEYKKHLEENDEKVQKLIS